VIYAIILACLGKDQFQGMAKGLLGLFQKTEIIIMKATGIKQGEFNKIKDLITVK
jgi:hypothetical protein